MADIQLDVQGNPSTPAASTAVLFVNSTNKEFQTIDDAGTVKTVRTLTNANTADVTASAADTYLTGSSITVPTQLLRAGNVFKWRFKMTKTAAGTATDIWNIRVGTTGTTADTARVTFTMGAQTAATDDGWAEMEMVVRAGGASTQVEAILWFYHTNTTTGLNATQSQLFQSTPATFDGTTAGLIVGVSNNPGASGVWTFQHVRAEATNL